MRGKVRLQFKWHGEKFGLRSDSPRRFAALIRCHSSAVHLIARTIHLVGRRIRLGCNNAGYICKAAVGSTLAKSWTSRHPDPEA